MTQLETILAAFGVLVLMAVVAPFTRTAERDDTMSESGGQVYVLYALIGLNVAVLAGGLTVAAAATFSG